MRNVRVCIYGGTHLQTHAEFISELTYKIPERMRAVIVTGGYLHQGNPERISTDAAALEGARRYASMHGVDLKERYEAWIPDPVLDKRRSA